MGHAGAIVFGSEGGYTNKVKTLLKSGVKIANTLSEIVSLISEITHAR